MNYNPEIQYRCTIIRGKSISKMDDFLPIYAQILDNICPCSIENFSDNFNRELYKFLKEDEKTLNNHRTENASKLLGMYYSKENIIYPSDRTKKFLSDNDQPAFFKDVCYKFQQPNGSQKIQTLLDKINHKTNFKPYHFLIKLLMLAFEVNIILTKDEIGYYVLNSLQVLQGKIKPEIIIERIKTDRANSLINKVQSENKAYSYNMQHINEQLDYLELSNLIRKDSTNVVINKNEKNAIEFFIKGLDRGLEFKVDDYNLQNTEERKRLFEDWQFYFSKLSTHDESIFNTKLLSLEPSGLSPDELSKIELGDEGENFVFKIEKERVAKFNKRLVNKVLYLGKTKGLGYDLTSIEAEENLANPEFVRYIEVKSTKRATKPGFSNHNWSDTINLSRNEWVAASQFKSSFFIYRVYFTPYGVFINVLHNPFEKNEQGVLYATPTSYRIEFDNNSIDKTLEFSK